MIKIFSNTRFDDNENVHGWRYEGSRLVANADINNARRLVLPIAYNFDPGFKICALPDSERTYLCSGPIDVGRDGDGRIFVERPPQRTSESAPSIDLNLMLIGVTAPRAATISFTELIHCAILSSAISGSRRTLIAIIRAFDDGRHASIKFTFDYENSRRIGFSETFTWDQGCLSPRSYDPRLFKS